MERLDYIVAPGKVYILLPEGWGQEAAIWSLFPRRSSDLVIHLLYDLAVIAGLELPHVIAVQNVDGRELSATDDFVGESTIY
jgi:hypothetical protein